MQATESPNTLDTPKRPRGRPRRWQPAPCVAAGGGAVVSEQGVCGHDYFVAYSCKGRGVCPSCCTRRRVKGDHWANWKRVLAGVGLRPKPDPAPLLRYCAQGLDRGRFLCLEGDRIANAMLVTSTTMAHLAANYVEKRKVQPDRIPLV